MITLTTAALADIAAVRSWSDFAAHLSAIHRQRDMSLPELERISRRFTKPLRQLPTSTVSEVLNGKRLVRKDLLESLLEAWQLPRSERGQLMELWLRLSARVGQGPPGAGRFDEASPRELGVHPAISVDGAASDLPSYVHRDFDDRLRDLISTGAERGCFVLLLGQSSCGKTRSLFEAVRETVPDWWLVQPFRTQEILDLLDTPIERTILWLDDLHRYLGADPPLRKTHIAELRRRGTIIVGTVWPVHYFQWKGRPLAEGGVAHSEDALLLDFAEWVRVPDQLSGAERRSAAEAAASDPTIAAALAVSDAGLTQVLAAGPDLVNCWEQAPDQYSRAVLSAAADARRLGVHRPLSPAALTDAMTDYLSPADRVTPRDSWLDRALRHATIRLHGAVAPLTPVALERAGSAEGYVVADYLTQHISRVRRSECPPESLWRALTTHVVDVDDLRRLAATALARLRYRYAEQALDRLHRAGDHEIGGELAALLRRQDRLAEALAVIDQCLAAEPGNKARRHLRADFLSMQSRAEDLRTSGEADLHAQDRLWELLADGGKADSLRTGALAGRSVDLEDLSELLVDRGCLEELREWADRGHGYAAERLAELLASLGLTDELRARAERDDLTAAVHLERADLRQAELADRHARRSELQAAADAGDEAAAVELTILLFETGDRDDLLAEVNAGVHRAADRYLAMIMADPAVAADEVRRIRAFGLRPDGRPEEPRP